MGRQATAVRQWTAMVRVTKLEMVTVKAMTLDDAIRAVDEGRWEPETVVCDLVDWERQGEPKEES